ncbi:MAG TPA: hypothetical protein ENF26_06855 [Methanomicrobia archaeon]|nr:hypothetical protein [Methanomicrobia archaeon]HEX59846.1 hypothetical protein [Methanomicrobia archaeon]
MLRCSRCGNKISECDNCVEPFQEGDDIICLDIGVGYAHYCCEECRDEDIENNTRYGKAVIDERR